MEQLPELKRGQYTLETGYVDVGDGHTIWYELWGSPVRTRVFVNIHGGPGGGTSDSARDYFNPSIDTVLFFDQRGSGKSLPHGCLENNTTQHIVSDIDALTTHCQLEAFTLVGGSWGSALALVYAIAHPRRVRGMVLRGVFTATRWENDFLNLGAARYYYPQEWERFISYVPVEMHNDGKKVIQFFFDAVTQGEMLERQKYADEYLRWVAATVSRTSSYYPLERSIAGNEMNITHVALQLHYYTNDAFLEDDYIMNNLDSIQHIPLYMVQGRNDTCTPPVIAYNISKAYGDNAHLNIISGGHIGPDGELVAVTKATIALVG